MKFPEKTSLTVSVTYTSARLLSRMREVHKEEQAAFIASLMEQGAEKRAARIQMAMVRAERWPRIEAVVAEALRERLAEPDLAGPWPELTRTEAARLALSGGWPGPHLGGPRLVQRNYSLPTPLVRQLRTASWRVSEEPLRLLEERGLVGAGTLFLDDQEQAERAELAERLHSPGRIVRQALGRYGPMPATAGPDGQNDGSPS